jgi:hypothetical protein
MLEVNANGSDTTNKFLISEEARAEAQSVRLNSCVILIPVYRDRLPYSEECQLLMSLKNLYGFPIYYFGPEDLDASWYLEQTSIRSSFIPFSREYFKSPRTYSKLLLDISFYDHITSFDFHLICQTDAVVLKPNISEFLEYSFDYWGAPWPKGWSIETFLLYGQVRYSLRLCAFVGNGGVSLRRTSAIIDLMNEYSAHVNSWRDAGNPEDLFFSLFGQISKSFKLPNIKQAASFAIELEPSLMLALNNGRLPFAVHQWDRIDKQVFLNHPEWPNFAF